ncbi:MAG: DEAD/DEAH box helicase [Desulfobacteraceae bacterium]|nr:DEAD/DEAH box helicase [Desulfobacteraceae bacterium]
MLLEDLFSCLPPDRLEYHRNAAALVPDKNDPDPGVSVLTIDVKTGIPRLQCNCGASGKKRKCPHVALFSECVRQGGEIPKDNWLDAGFRKSPWYLLAAALHGACPVEPERLVVEFTETEAENIREIQILRPDNELLVFCRLNPASNPDTGTDETDLLLERTRLRPSHGNPFHRGRILEMLGKMTLTESEHAMQAHGIKNRRQALEESFWYRLAYHFRSLAADNGGSLDTYIDEATGRFMVRCEAGRFRRLDIAVPSNAAMRVRQELEPKRNFQNQERIPLWPEALESIVKVTADESNNLRLTLFLLLDLPDGSTEAIERSRLKKYWYKDTVYIPEKQVFATLKSPDRYAPVFGRNYTKKIKQEKLAGVIEKLGDIFSPPNIIDPGAQQLKIYRESSRVEIEPSAMDRDWCWLSVYYGFGENVSVSLSDIYEARISGKRYLPVADGFVDTRATDPGALTGQPGTDVSTQLADGKKTLRMSRMDLLRLQAAFDKPVLINDRHRDFSGEIKAILEMRPSFLRKPGAGMSSPLREYQENGTRWLGFLHENRFGGLLCDEMGLGKTHQVMALMSWLAEHGRNPGPFLVVCPTTVISHWERKIREHAPGLRPFLYHGATRELRDLSEPATVLITSYGILLRDADILKKYRFSAAAFDEAHYIKNPATKSYNAALTLNADLKIAVTGTPIENRLTDLKALMDLVLPGYLGSDDEFRLRYEAGDRNRKDELRRLVGPFILRRTKAAVLDELPEKIEDIRYCSLTDVQVRLYRDAVAGRGKAIRRQLINTDKDIPYIHIFALLTLLKQICNHPATISENPEETRGEFSLSETDSGKWELFVELLDTCLENDRKVVVFSQFVSMVDLIIQYLESRNIKTASITGRTRSRGTEIDRFNNDPDCRVFVGSLKAGGSGIDLTGGSVVIHYDRWWNAAKEDQATDRVHRIGQSRGVQVFKLVTEGTLEEKISAIVEHKKNLLNNVIAEDDPGLLKTFTRDELLELMEEPDGVSH